MASGSLTAAALRHRPRQAALIIVLAAVVSASASLGPLYARATEQSILRTVLSEAPVAERGVVVTSSTNTPPSPQRLAHVVDEVRSTAYGPAIGGADASVTVRGFAVSGGSKQAAAQLTSREGLCRHVVLVAGSCLDPDGDSGSVLVSQRNADLFHIETGDVLSLTDANNNKVSRTVTVAGIYRAFDANNEFWFGRRANAAIPPPRQDEPTPRVFDAVYTAWPTLQSQKFSTLRTYADLPLRIQAIDLRNLSDVLAARRSIERQARTVQASSVTGLPELVAASNSQRKQTRVVIPALAIQLAVLGVVVLAFVCAAATEARRPEVALARLRGQGSGGAAALLLRELGLVILIGSLVGGAVGWLVAKFASARWLAPGVTLELRWPVLAAVAAAAVAGLARGHRDRCTDACDSRWSRCCGACPPRLGVAGRADRGCPRCCSSGGRGDAADDGAHLLGRHHRRFTESRCAARAGTARRCRRALARPGDRAGLRPRGRAERCARATS